MVYHKKVLSLSYNYGHDALPCFGVRNTATYALFLKLAGTAVSAKYTPLAVAFGSFQSFDENSLEALVMVRMFSLSTKAGSNAGAPGTDSVYLRDWTTSELSGFHQPSSY